MICDITRANRLSWLGRRITFFQAFMLSIVGKTIIEYARSTDGSNGKSTKREPHLTRAETKVRERRAWRRRNPAVGFEEGCPGRWGL